MKKRSLLPRVVSIVLGVLVISLLWELLGRIFLVALFPEPLLIFHAIIELLAVPQLQEAVLYSVGNIYIGVGIAFLFSFIVAVLRSLYGWFNLLVEVPIDVFRNIAALSLYPVFLVIFGLGREAHVAIIVWNTWAGVLLTTYAALVSVEKEVLEAAQLDGATDWQIMCYMKLPLIMLDVLLAVRVAFGLGWFAIIVSEMLGGTRGLGYLVMHYSNAFDFPKMYATIIITSFCGFAMSLLWMKMTEYMKNRYL